MAAAVFAVIAESRQGGELFAAVARRGSSIAKATDDMAASAPYRIRPNSHAARPIIARLGMKAAHMGSR